MPRIFFALASRPPSPFCEGAGSKAMRDASPTKVSERGSSNGKYQGPQGRFPRQREWDADIAPRRTFHQKPPERGRDAR